MKNKTSDEMFKELNGILYNNHNLQYDFYNEVESDLISYSLIFYLDEKVYVFIYGFGGYPEITPVLHQAITKKMEELGWI